MYMLMAFSVSSANRAEGPPFQTEISIEIIGDSRAVGRNNTEKTAVALRSFSQ